MICNYGYLLENRLVSFNAYASDFLETKKKQNRENGQQTLAIDPMNKSMKCAVWIDGQSD